MSGNLVDIEQIIPNIQISLRYAGSDNIFGKAIYPFQKCYLLREAAFRLRKVQWELEKMDLQLLVWDGFRPLEMQWKLWEILPDERYVADPRKGGRHTRGTSVDVTLLDKDGRELAMPCGFDDFSEKAHRDFMDLPLEKIRNRQLLENAMQMHGFLGISTEWWHFDLAGWEKYPPLNMYEYD